MSNEQPKQKTISPEFFVRLEEKYLLPEQKLSEFQNTLDECASEQVNLKKESYVVESIYYDTPLFDSYQKHFDQANVRYKLRERRYLNPDNPHKKSTSFLELKEKHNGVCTKSRIKISETESKALASNTSLTLSPELIALNNKESIENLKNFIEKSNTLTIGAAFTPQCKIQYQRNAVECPLFRITYDTNLEYKSLSPSFSSQERSMKEKIFWNLALKMKESFECSPHIIVEVKHKGLLPEKITTFFHSLKIQEQSFSKYIYSMTSLFDSLERLQPAPKKSTKEIFHAWNTLKEVAL